MDCSVFSMFVGKSHKFSLKDGGEDEAESLLTSSSGEVEVLGGELEVVVSDAIEDPIS